MVVEGVIFSILVVLILLSLPFIAVFSWISSNMFSPIQREPYLHTLHTSTNTWHPKLDSAYDLYKLKLSETVLSTSPSGRYHLIISKFTGYNENTRTFKAVVFDGNKKISTIDGTYCFTPFCWIENHKNNQDYIEEET